MRKFRGEVLSKVMWAVIEICVQKSSSKKILTANRCSCSAVSQTGSQISSWACLPRDCTFLMWILVDVTSSGIIDRLYNGTSGVFNPSRSPIEIRYQDRRNSIHLDVASSDTLSSAGHCHSRSRHD